MFNYKPHPQQIKFFEEFKDRMFLGNGLVGGIIMEPKDDSVNMDDLAKDEESKDIEDSDIDDITDEDEDEVEDEA